MALGGDGGDELFGGYHVGIDASRNRSGGARAHITGILTEGNPIKYGIREVHVWAYRSLLDSIPDRPWLIKHSPKELEQKLGKQLLWQATKLSKEVVAAGCNILFTTDASTLCRFRPMVVMNQDMLSYEPGVMRNYRFTRARLRLLTILIVQNQAMRFADGVIFLTRYAAQVIQHKTGKLNRIAIIPHGVDLAFKRNPLVRPWPREKGPPIYCLYVSNIDMYKHQWEVVQAITKLRNRGHDINLVLAGGGSGRAQQILDDEISVSDPQRLFVEDRGFVKHDELPSLLSNANLFVFASSCENFPVTLLEAMTTGLPIACSNRGPMPEVLADGGVYFDPENSDSIADAVEQLITNASLREKVARRAKTLSEQYSWSRCANETWAFIVDTYRSIKA